MKSKDVKTGVVYAFRASEFSTPAPVVVLDASRMYYGQFYSQFGAGHEKPVFSHHGNEGMRATGDAHGGVGFVGASTVRDIRHTSSINVKSEDFESPHLRLLSVTLAQALSMKVQDTAHHRAIPDTKRAYPSLVNPRFLVGEWEDVWEAYNDERDDKAAARQAKEDRETANQKRYDSLVARLRELGIKIPEERWSMGKRPHADVTLTGDQTEALLSLIPEGARLPAGDEQWEYPASEGQR